MKIAIYPGSFDPITNGHLDILKRALKVFDKVIVLVANNSSKTSRFTIEERVQMVNESIGDLTNVEVDSYDGLTVDYAKKVKATHMIRGLRAVTDFEYEFQLSAANEFIDSSIDMVFFMSHQETNFISSSTIHEMVKNNIDVSKLVPETVIKKYKEKFDK